MNRESNDFAEFRFSQRMARDVSYYYPGRHYKPEHTFPWRPLVCFAGLALIGWVLYIGA